MSDSISNTLFPANCCFGIELCCTASRKPDMPVLTFSILGTAAAAVTPAVVAWVAGAAVAATAGVAATTGVADANVGTVLRVFACLAGGGVVMSEDVLRLLPRLAAGCCSGGCTTEAVTGMAMSGTGLTGAMGEYTEPGGGVVEEEAMEASGATEGWEGGPGFGYAGYACRAAVGGGDEPSGTTGTAFAYCGGGAPGGPR